MKNIWKTIFNSTAIPFRLVIFIFGGRGRDKWIPAGRYTRPAMMEAPEPSAHHLLGES